MNVERRSPFIEQTQSSELLAVQNGLLFITHEDACIDVSQKVILGPGESMTAPLRLDLLSEAAQEMASHPLVEISQRSKWAHLCLDSLLTTDRETGEKALAITNYSKNRMKFEGLIPFTRFMVKGTELRDEALQNAADRIQLAKEAEIDFIENQRGEQFLKLPVDHKYVQRRLKQVIDLPKGLSSPRNRVNLARQYGLQEVPLYSNHMPDDSMMIIGTPHAFLSDVGLMITGAGKNSDNPDYVKEAWHQEDYPHGSAYFIDPQTNWTVNGEVFSVNGTEPPDFLVAKAYNVVYVGGKEPNNNGLMFRNMVQSSV